MQKMQHQLWGPAKIESVDLEILAIAATGQTLYTDDYSLQNVCRHLNHPFEACQTNAKSLVVWELRCIGCRATKSGSS